MSLRHSSEVARCGIKIKGRWDRSASHRMKIK